MWSELKNFLLRGDVITLAVAFIIGGAFNSVVTSLVNDVIMPVITMFISPEGFKNLTIGPIMIGNFIAAVINFLIVGTALFFLIKAAGKKPEEAK